MTGRMAPLSTTYTARIARRKDVFHSHLGGEEMRIRGLGIESREKGERKREEGRGGGKGGGGGGELAFPS